MSKITTTKTTDFEPLRTARQTEVSQTGTAKSGSVKNKSSAGEDKLQVSDRAAEAGKLRDQLKEMPDIRQAKVSELREQIEAGEYSPSGDEIAAAILKDEENG